MRQIVLDTETTGLEVERGHRIIEIGCVELVNRRRTPNTFHYYLQPDREIDQAAEDVHGISLEQLQGQPRFGDIVEEFLAFVSGAELIIHNADFDVGFLNRELELTNPAAPSLRDCCGIVDSLLLAREMHPGQRNSLDALCKRYSVDNSNRSLHGALLDAELLAEVYLAMTGGQGSLSLVAEGPNAAGATDRLGSIDRAGLVLAVRKASEAELTAHERQLDLIDESSAEGAVWRRH